jgi:predicted dehydrogenase
MEIAQKSTPGLFTPTPLIFQERAANRVLKIGVIGYGYWGPKLVRNFQEAPATRVTMVADRDPSRLNQLHRTHADLEITNDYQALLASDVDAVVVATPVSTHFPIAMDCLRHGKHVLVEKPLARTSAEAQQLVALAARQRLVLMVGHTFEYNPAVEMLKTIVDSGEIGRVYYLNSSRTNLGIFQKDVNVIWDLAPHDISILLYLLGVDPLDVSACGSDYVQPGIHDVARLTLNFPNQVQAHVHLSWLDPCKVRRTTIVGAKKMIVYDDLEMHEKIKIYDTGVSKPEHTDNYGEFQLSYRYGDITIPRIPLHEPLKVECAHFADSILHGRQPRSNGEVGLKVVKILEHAEKSLLNGGMREPLM